MDMDIQSQSSGTCSNRRGQAAISRCRSALIASLLQLLPPEQRLAAVSRCPSFAMPGPNRESGLGPTSRTQQYRKVMKPLLERRRRARINGYLNELKQLITELAQLDEETLTKLEKADLLELTVQHLQSQRYAAEPQVGAGAGTAQQLKHFRLGFLQCIQEVSRLLRPQDKQLNSLLLNGLHQLMATSSTSYWRPW